MAEKHDRIEAKYRQGLLNKGYKIIKKCPLHDYRPDIYAQRGATRLMVEVEIEKSLHNDHTLNQLSIMHEYIRKKNSYKGVLVVPLKAKEEAEFLVKSIFGDKKIKVEAIKP